MTPRTLSLVAAVVAIVAIGAPASAQQTVPIDQTVPTPQSPTPGRQQRPYRGLFGGGVGETEHLLSMNLSFGVGFDDDIQAGLQGGGGGGSANQNQLSSGFGQAQGSLSYSLTKSKVSFSTSVGGGTTYYTNLTDPFVFSNHANLGGSWRIAPRSVLSGSFSRSHQPFRFLPGGTIFFDNGPRKFLQYVQQEVLNLGLEEEIVVKVPPVLTSQTVDAEEEMETAYMQGISFNHAFTSRISTSLRMDHQDRASSSGLFDQEQFIGGAALSASLTRRVSLTASASQTRMRSSDQSFNQDGRSLGGGVGVLLGKGFGLRFGYTESITEFGEGEDRTRFRSRMFDGGLTFNKALSLTRRTHLSFNTGTSGMNDGQETRYTLTGMAMVTREIGRTWSADLTYNRNVGFQAFFQGPVFSDTLSGGIKGLVARRLQVQASAGVARGSVGFGDEGTDNGFSSKFANAGLTVGLTRNLGLAVDYSLFRYEFGDDVAIAPGLSRKVDRQRISISLNVWEPLYHRARRQNASR